MRIRLIAATLLAASAPLAMAAKPVRHHSLQHNVRHGATSHASYSHSSYARTSHASHATGMDSERATQIQSALIKQGYLTGEPTGTWDSRTVSAMQKLQGDNGWQTRVTPDARALIKLGLGPQQAASSQPMP